MEEKSERSTRKECKENVSTQKKASVTSKVNKRSRKGYNKFNTISALSKNDLKRMKAEFDKHGETTITTGQLQTPCKMSSNKKSMFSTTERNQDLSLNRKTQQKNEDSVRVFVRIRPLRRQITRPGENSLEDKTVPIVVASEDNRSLNIGSDTECTKKYTFDHVFDERSDQAQIFESVGRPVVDAACQGFNGSVFAYGQTGSGKTHTMLGSPEDPGLIPRVLQYLFASLAADAQKQNPSMETRHIVRVSYVEIYNERVTDLLDPEAGTKNLRENIKRGVYVDDLVEKEIRTTDDAVDWMEVGNSNRKTSSTAMNDQSSRSHAVFTLTVEMSMVSTDTGVRITRHSRVNLVDLAGSERQKDTLVTGAQLKEASTINKSLSVLGNVIMSLANFNKNSSTRSKQHIHYRDSKLTFLLRDSLGGNTRTSMIATVSPGDKNFSESLSTLKFAARAKFIQNKVVANEDAAGTTESLRNEINRLKSKIRKTCTSSFRMDESAKKELDHYKTMLLKQDSVWKRKLASADVKLKEALERAERAESKLESLALSHAISDRRESSFILKSECPRSSLSSNIIRERQTTKISRVDNRQQKWRESLGAMQTQGADSVVDGPVRAIQIEELTEKNECLAMQLSCVTDERDTIVEVNTEIKHQNMTLKSTVAKLQQQINEMKDRIEKHPSFSPGKKSSVAEMENNLYEFKKNAEREIIELTEAQDMTKQQLELVKRDLKTSASTAITLQKELGAKRVVIKEMESVTAELRSELKEVKERLQDLSQISKQKQAMSNPLVLTTGAAAQAMKSFGMMGLGVTHSQHLAEKQKYVMQESMITVMQKKMSKLQSENESLKERRGSCSSSDNDDEGRESVVSNASTTGSTLNFERYVSPVKQRTRSSASGAKFSVAKFFPGRGAQKYAKEPVKRRDSVLSVVDFQQIDTLDTS